MKYTSLIPTSHLERVICLLSLFVLGLLGGCSGPEPVDLVSLIQRGEVYLDPSGLEPYTGPVFTRFESDTTKIEQWGQLLNGMWEGATEVYYENGQLRETKTMRLGKQDGAWVSYYPNGEMESLITFKDGQLDGPMEAYYENGQLQDKSTARGTKSVGPFESYSADGQLIMKGTYDDDGEFCGDIVMGEMTSTAPPCPPSDDSTR